MLAGGILPQLITAMSGRRGIIIAFTVFLFIVVVHQRDNILPTDTSVYLQRARNSAFGSDVNGLSPHVLNYYEQVWSADTPAKYDFPALKEQCKRTIWQPENEEVFLQCGGMAAGLTTIMSQVKVCLKMAVEGGTGIILPKMPLRSSEKLDDFNFLNPDAYMTLDKWFEGGYFVSSMARICPQMRIIHPDDIESGKIIRKHEWPVNLASAPGYQQYHSYFWPGQPWRSFFDHEYTELKRMNSLTPDYNPTAPGITAIKVSSQFLVFRITDDPTGFESKVWADLAHLLRFHEAPRKITNAIMNHLGNRPFYGVHFRAENDTIWSSADHQLEVDLNALDQAWQQFGKPGANKPLVYLACGDEGQVNRFVAAGKERGWEVTHKWALAQGANDIDTIKMINELPFDFQGAVDMGIMVRSGFFLGITGSAFSSTIGNARDATGRYRGSSFTVWEDGNARTHLFNDGNSDAYPCCL